MKPKIIIDKDSIEIELKTTNKFEEEMIDNSQSYDATVKFDRDYKFGVYENHRVLIRLTKLKKEPRK